MKLCARCNHEIKPGEPHGTYDKVSPSAGGITVYIHDECPEE